MKIRDPHYATPHARQTGFTLIEIMVAVTISMVLLGGVMQVFVSSNKTYRAQEANARLQENGRFSIYFLSRDLRMADFWGCASFDNISNHLNPGGAGFIDFTAGGLAGADNTGLNGSDSITVRGAGDTGLTVQTPYMPTTSADLKVTVNNGINQNDILLVSDCTSGDAFQTTNANPDGTGQLVHNTGAVSSGPGNATKPFSKSYQGDAQVYRASETTYSIATGASGEPALFRSINGAAPEELVVGIENMQIVYGEDTDADGTANYYVPVGSVTNMDNVVSVRITLTARSQVTFPEVAAADKRLRRTFVTTITIRNRVS